MEPRQHLPKEARNAGDDEYDTNDSNQLKYYSECCHILCSF
jgi:hypothetical protein